MKNLTVGFHHCLPLASWTQTGDRRQMDSVRALVEGAGGRVVPFSYYDMPNCDLVHAFGFTHELAGIAVECSRRSLPFVYSPIVSLLQPPWARRLSRKLSALLPFDSSPLMLQRLMDHSRLLTVMSGSERAYLREAFSVVDSRMIEVPLVVSSARDLTARDRFLDRYPFLGQVQFLLMVGRISDRKGQLRLLEAVRALKVALVFCGHPAQYELSYFDAFRAGVAERPDTYYLGPLEDDLIQGAILAASAHALPSINESPGLISLEAAQLGCPVVGGENAVLRDYLGDTAHYCNPQDIDSIRSAVQMAMSQGRFQSGLYPKLEPHSVSLQLAAAYHLALGRTNQ